MKKIELSFENADGKTVRFSLDKPIEPVDGETVNAVMEEIISQNLFTSKGGDLVAKKGARLVENIVEEIELD